MWAMASVIKSNTKYKLLFLLLCIVVMWLLYLQFTEKKNLIATPSSHKQIVFLETKNERLSSKYKVYFCLYDKECDYIQICIKVPRNEEMLWQQLITLEFYIDGEKRGDYAHLGDTTWKGEYFNVLLDNIPEFETLQILYEGNTCEAYFSD